MKPDQRQQSQGEITATLRKAFAEHFPGVTFLEWPGGLVASVDGLRFVVPVATINAAPNPHYFGMRRGATWLNASVG